MRDGLLLFHGRIDAVTSSGYVEGWAFDADDPLRPLTVSVRAGGRIVAQGLAHLFRADLADAGCGTGWCAFRLRLSHAPARTRQPAVSLWDVSGRTEIHRAAGVLPLAEDHEPALSALGDILAADPTMVHAIEQLRACGPAFSRFIAAEGIEGFVRAAYVYVLGRPCDPTGMALYPAMLADGSLTPYELLQALYDSDEFRAAPRPLIAPPEPGFVFRAP